MLLPSQHEGLLAASNVQGVTALYSEFEGNSGGWSLGQDKPCESMASVQRIGPDGSAALAKVRSTIPTFENIPTEQIGLRTVTRSSVSVNPCSPADACNPAGIHTSAASVGGYAPSVSGLSLIGSAAVGGTVKAAYTYVDPDGDREGYSHIRWYVSDSVDGVYTRIVDRLGKELPLSGEYSGKYIKYEITPRDCRMQEGEPVTSAAFPVQ